MNRKNLTRQFHRLMKHIGSFSDGQAKVTDFTDSMDEITIMISPNGGLYEGGEFIFKIELEDRYPHVAPVVSCETAIYHPNIDAYDENLYDNVCLNILTDWDSNLDLECIVQALLYLFYYPNLDDPLSAMFTAAISEEKFKANVEKSLKGGVVDGFLFEQNRGQCGKINCCENLVTDECKSQKPEVVRSPDDDVRIMSLTRNAANDTKSSGEQDGNLDVIQNLQITTDAVQKRDHHGNNNCCSHLRRHRFRSRFSIFTHLFKSKN
ncbi:NEDD8-conjugating enzyme Ubc12-like [Glandiceps talaboti]